LFGLVHFIKGIVQERVCEGHGRAHLFPKRFYFTHKAFYVCCTYFKRRHPGSVAQKETQRADALFQGFEIEIFHHSDDLIIHDLIVIIGMVYFFSDGIGITQKLRRSFVDDDGQGIASEIRRKSAAFITCMPSVLK
jgi:hypothetical protein